FCCRKLEEISAVAERVPLLESRIEQLLKEKSEFEIRFAAQREELEHALEESLAETLSKYKEQSDYWTGKQAALEQSLERAKAEISQHLMEKEDMKMKAKLERADLERRLTSSIDHVQMLNSQINKSRRDVECEARPRHVSKYVACRPNSRSKSTTIAKVIDANFVPIKSTFIEKALTADVYDACDGSYSNGKFFSLVCARMNLSVKASSLEIVIRRHD
ncbi:unnamed protein product, partial [Cylicostephanus goldi]